MILTNIIFSFFKSCLFGNFFYFCFLFNNLLEDSLLFLYLISLLSFFCRWKRGRRNRRVSDMRTNQWSVKGRLKLFFPQKRILFIVIVIKKVILLMSKIQKIDIKEK